MNTHDILGTWEDHFAALVAYKERYGTIRVSQQHCLESPLYHSLHEWVRYQESHLNALNSEQRHMWSKLLLLPVDVPTAAATEEVDVDEPSSTPFAVQQRISDALYNRQRQRKRPSAAAIRSSSSASSSRRRGGREALANVGRDSHLTNVVMGGGMDSWAAEQEEAVVAAAMLRQQQKHQQQQQERREKEFLQRQRQLAIAPKPHVYPSPYNQRHQEEEELEEEEDEELGESSPSQVPRPATYRGSKFNLEMATAPPIKRNGVGHHQQWDAMFHRLVQYKQQYGNCNVPVRYAADPPFGKWVSRQREMYSKNALSATRIARLESIGFSWRIGKFNPNLRACQAKYEEHWVQRFQQLVEYGQQNNGDFTVPNDYPNRQFRGWVLKQRTADMRGELRPDRKQLLASIGFFDNHDQNNHTHNHNQHSGGRKRKMSYTFQDGEVVEEEEVVEETQPPTPPSRTKATTARASTKGGGGGIVAVPKVITLDHVQYNKQPEFEQEEEDDDDDIVEVMDAAKYRQQQQLAALQLQQQKQQQQELELYQMEQQMMNNPNLHPADAALQMYQTGQIPLEAAITLLQRAFNQATNPMQRNYIQQQMQELVVQQRQKEQQQAIEKQAMEQQQAALEQQQAAIEQQAVMEQQQAAELYRHQMQMKMRQQQQQQRMIAEQQQHQSMERERKQQPQHSPPRNTATKKRPLLQPSSSQATSTKATKTTKTKETIDLTKVGVVSPPLTDDDDDHAFNKNNYYYKKNKNLTTTTTRKTTSSTSPPRPTTTAAAPPPPEQQNQMYSGTKYIVDDHKGDDKMTIIPHFAQPVARDIQVPSVNAELKTAWDQLSKLAAAKQEEEEEEAPKKKSCRFVVKSSMAPPTLADIERPRIPMTPLLPSGAKQAIRLRRKRVGVVPNDSNNNNKESADVGVAAAAPSKTIPTTATATAATVVGKGTTTTAPSPATFAQDTSPFSEFGKTASTTTPPSTSDGGSVLPSSSNDGNDSDNTTTSNTKPKVNLPAMVTPDRPPAPVPIVPLDDDTANENKNSGDSNNNIKKKGAEEKAQEEEEENKPVLFLNDAKHKNNIKAPIVPLNLVVTHPSKSVRKDITCFEDAFMSVMNSTPPLGAPTTKNDWKRRKIGWSFVV